jgi:hypothetical protein
MYRKIVTIMFVATLWALAAGRPALADDLPALTLDPIGGALKGAAGSTVGWGFTLTNPGSDFAVVTGTDFCVGVISSPCTNALGIYSDIAGGQFLVVGPGNSSVPQAFNDVALTGVGSFLINSGATGSVNGMLVLTYDLYSVNPTAPNFDPILDTQSVGNELTTAASVTVASEAVPEPGSLVLVMSGIAGCWVAKRRAGRSAASRWASNRTKS